MINIQNMLVREKMILITLLSFYMQKLLRKLRTNLIIFKQESKQELISFKQDIIKEVKNELEKPRER
jgi:hypothetical protein